jgi:hypothetical protein
MCSLNLMSGVQSLRHITARASSARVLDLVSLAQDEAENPDHRERPLFTHPVLNRTIIVKHHPRPGDFDYRPNRRAVTTKVVFPFDPADLELGGQFLLADTPDLAEQLARQLDYAGADLANDLAVLRVLETLPTLDPFLLAEALAAERKDVAPCYFRLSPADREEMLGFVAEQVETLIQLCFSGAKAHELKAKRLSELLLAEGDSPELDPLREALRLEPEAFPRSVFFWKAMLFYRWRSRVLAPDLKATRRSIASIDIKRFPPPAALFVARASTQLESMITSSERRIAEMFKAYDDVFEALTEQRSPEPFRRFLIDGPGLFAQLGVSMGRLEQLISFWSHQFPERNTRRLSPEVVTVGLRNLVSALGLKSHGAAGASHAAAAPTAAPEVPMQRAKPAPAMALGKAKVA